MLIPSWENRALDCILGFSKCCAQAGVSSHVCYVLIWIYLPRRGDAAVPYEFNHLTSQIILITLEKMLCIVLL
jgi:hypothetical protein